MPGTAQEHFDHCVERAMTYMYVGKPKRAVEILIIDLNVHAGTKPVAASSEFSILTLGTMNDPEKFREALESLRAKML